MSLVERSLNVMKRPAAEWPVIAEEPASIASLYGGYVAILAAIPALAGFIGLSVFGISVPFVGTVRVPFMSGLVQMLVSYGLGLAAVYGLAWLASFLAPRFGGEADLLKGFKLAAYSATAAWLAGIFTLIPVLSPLGIVGLYSVYLLYTGVPVLMRVPREKALVYTVVLLVCAVVAGIAISAVSGAFIPTPSLGVAR